MSFSSTGGNNIVTHLILKDVGRYVAGMKAAEKATKDLGKASDSTGRKIENTGKKLDKDSKGWRKRAKDVRGFGGSLVFTEKKLTSFAITAGIYLAPAIVALGNSFAAAAMGGGLVAGGGLAALTVGLSGIGIIAFQAGKNIKKVTTAMDAADLAVLQYGANSDEAARAATHLSAVIDQQGGPIVYKVIRSYRALNKEWTDLTKTARQNLFKSFYSGLRGLRRLMPTFAKTTNETSGALAANFATMSKNLSGHEIRKTITMLGHVFTSMSKPLAHGIVDIIITMVRWLRAAAPYSIELAENFRDWAHSLRRNSRDSGRLRRTVGDLVSNFKAWWGLAKALGRTFKILFGASKDEGRDFVLVLTDLVDNMNDWLQFKEANGEVSAFFRNWIRGVESVGHWIGLLFTDQSEAAAQLGNFMSQLASHALSSFLQAWWKMDWSGKLFTGIYVAAKLGIFSTLGQAAANRFITNFGTKVSDTGAAEQTVAMSGKRIGFAFAKGLLVGILLYRPITDAVTQMFPNLKQYSGKKGWGELARDIGSDFGKLVGGSGSGNPGTFTQPPGPPKHKAGGGMIPMGQWSMVGERGPEWALATSAGIGVLPIRSQMHAAPQPVDQGRDLASSDHDKPRIIQLVVGGKVLAEAVDRVKQDRAARRGEDT